MFSNLDPKQMLLSHGFHCNTVFLY